MQVPLRGSPEYLFSFVCLAEAVQDVFVPDNYIWVMPPLYVDRDQETIKILSSPKNYKYAQELAQKHNEIFDSPLAKALREED
jgi:hypothetical protein